VYTNILGQPIYLINHPELIRLVLVESADSFGKRRAGQQGLNRNPTKIEQFRTDHRRLRKLIQPAFTPASVNRYAPIVTAYTQELLTEWEHNSIRSLPADLNTLTLRIVAKALFNLDIREKTDIFADAIHKGIAFLETGEQPGLNLLIPTRRNLQLITAWKRMENTVKSLIAERRAAGTEGDDLLSKMLIARDEHGTLTDQEAYELVFGLLIAGHETVSNGLEWAFYLLDQSPSVQTALHTQARLPNLSDYFEWIFRESMRLYPPAWVMERYTLRPVELGGYTLPAGALVYFSQYVLHRDERYFFEPDRFIPERWGTESVKNVPPYAYFPFGGGSHVCTGMFFAWMEAPLILREIARRYRVEVINRDTIFPQPLITLRPAPDIQVRVTPL
jgi:cytochrome P450